MENTNFIDEVYDKFFLGTLCGKNELEFGPKSKLDFYQYISEFIKNLYGNQNIDIDEILKQIKVSYFIPSISVKEDRYKALYTRYIGFILENNEGKQAVIHLAVDYVSDGIDEGIREVGDDILALCRTRISGKVIAPFKDLKYSQIEPNSNTLFATDPKTGKTALFSIITKRPISKEYDYIEKTPFGFRVENNGKIGRIYPYAKDFNIPVKYDEITRIANGDLDKNLNPELKWLLDRRETCYIVDMVRKQDKVGAYCYTKDFHVIYHSEEDRSSYHSYIKKAFIAPIFDTLDCIQVQDRLFLIVSINGKYGVLDPYKHKFISPTIFDVITKINIIDDDTPIIYGEIDEEEYYYKNNVLIKNQQCEVALSDEFILARGKIEKQAK